MSARLDPDTGMVVIEPLPVVVIELPAVTLDLASLRPIRPEPAPPALTLLEGSHP